MDRVPTAPFFLSGDRRGVLCIHGFTGTPYEMQYLGDSLGHRGLSVRGIALPGHGTDLADLFDKTWRDWSAAVVAAYDELATECDHVAVVGQSLGGLLALYLATMRRPAAVVSLAAPLWLGGFGGAVARAVTTGWLAGRVKILPKLGGSDVRLRAARDANPSYRGFPVTALGELLAFMDVVDACLPAVDAPLLIMHARNDHTAPVASARRICDRVSSRQRALHILPESYHLIAIDVERALVAREVGAWCERHLGCP